MSCYLRRMKDILEEADIEVTPANKKQINQTIHQVVGVTYQHCPETRKQLKQQLTGSDQARQEFISQLKSTL